jgi:hypothetical protein
MDDKLSVIDNLSLIGNSADMRNDTPVLVTNEMPWMTEEQYGGMAGVLLPRLQTAAGFLAHAAGPRDGGGWQVTELWASQQAHDAWFDASVAPNLPSDAQPPVTTVRHITSLITAPTPAPA